METSYNKLWKKLIDQKMTKTQLKQAAQMSTSTLAKMGRDEMVSMDVLARICKVLHCDIGDIVEFIEKDGDEK